MNLDPLFEIIFVTTSSRKLPFIPLLSLTFSVLLSGCLGTKYLKDDEKLLYKQSIKDRNGLSIDALEAQYRQKPNRRMPLVPLAHYVYLYHWGLNHYDTAKYHLEGKKIEKKMDAKIAKAEAKGKKHKAGNLRNKKNHKLDKVNKSLKEGNLRMRWGEEVIAYKPELREQTESHLMHYMQSQGFFNAEATSHTQEKGKRVSVVYEIDKKEEYVIDSVLYQIADLAVKQLVLSSSTSSLLKKERYRQETLAAERERINEMLLNSGYYLFNKQLIGFRVDTGSLGGQKVLVKVEIKPSPDGSPFKKYVIDSVNFVTEAKKATVSATKSRPVAYNGVTYSFYQERYNKKILDWRIFLSPDSLYSQANTFETQRQLANLDVFKFVNINYDTTGSSFVANIFTSPLQKYQVSAEAGINVSQGAPGPFFNFNLKDRNIFKGLEILEFSGRFGVEGVASPSDITDVYATTEYGGNLHLTFPQFIIPASIERKSHQGQLNPRTRLLVGATVTDRIEYKRTNLNSSWSYIWQNNNNRLFNLTLADISYINSELSPGFSEFLNDYKKHGNLLANSFKPSYVSSTSFSVIINANRYGMAQGDAGFIKFYLETSGLPLYLVSRQRLMESSLEFYQFSKLNIDFRKIHSLSSRHQVAYRINTGVAVPYGINTVLPYEKYFFAGGSNGIRAWRPRRLGPGAYTPPLSDDPKKEGLYDYSFEQPGEVLLEASAEYRRRLFKFVSWAFFIDAGNVWTLHDDLIRPGGQFHFDSFVRQIAIGAGLGLRFDFSFLILRLDAAAKMHDPARPPGQRWIGQKFFTQFPFGEKEQTILNIGIGYPF